MTTWQDVRIVTLSLVFIAGLLGFALARLLLATGPVPRYHEVVGAGSQVLLLESPAGQYAYFKARDQVYKIRLDY